MSPGTILDGDKRILEARKPTVRLPQEGVEPSRTTAAAQAQVRQPITCSISDHMARQKRKLVASISDREGIGKNWVSSWEANMNP